MSILEDEDKRRRRRSRVRVREARGALAELAIQLVTECETCLSWKAQDILQEMQPHVSAIREEEAFADD